MFEYLPFVNSDALAKLRRVDLSKALHFKYVDYCLSTGLNQQNVPP